MNLAVFHIATIRNGQPDDHQYNNAFSRVSYDQKTDYYDFSGLNVTADEFRAFVADVWDNDNVDVVVIEPGVYRADLD